MQWVSVEWSRHCVKEEEKLSGSIYEEYWLGLRACRLAARALRSDKSWLVWPNLWSGLVISGRYGRSEVGLVGIVTCHVAVSRMSSEALVYKLHTSFYVIIL